MTRPGPDKIHKDIFNCQGTATEEKPEVSGQGLRMCLQEWAQQSSSPWWPWRRPWCPGWAPSGGAARPAWAFQAAAVPVESHPLRQPPALQRPSAASLAPEMRSPLQHAHINAHMPCAALGNIVFPDFHLHQSLMPLHLGHTRLQPGRPARHPKLRWTSLLLHTRVQVAELRYFWEGILERSSPEPTRQPGQETGPSPAAKQECT